MDVDVGEKELENVCEGMEAGRKGVNGKWYWP